MSSTTPKRHFLPATCLSAFALLAVSGLPAVAQQGAPSSAGQGGQQPPGSGAEELVGLFGATCLHFAGSPSGVRGFLNEQKVPVMPQTARAAFLAGRAGQVFDASEPGVNLAVVTLDDGGCETVVEKANPDEVLSTLIKTAQDAKTPLTPLGDQADKAANGVRHAAFALTENGRTMHILVSTAAAPPQAVLTLAPK
jgi:hypothetical protein